MTAIVPRLATPRLDALVASFRVAIVNGPRQAGKTTVLRLLHDRRGGSLRSLDDPTSLDTAIADPRTFIEQGPLPRIIDEVQRGGDPLILAIKHAVDRDDRRGQFVLSGSTRFLTVPTVSESLAGRAVFVDMWPFAMVERVGAPPDLPTLLLTDPTTLLGAAPSPWGRDDYLGLVCTGGFPEVVDLPAATARSAWFDSYVRTVVTRDVRSFADIRHGEAVPTLLSLVAARSGSMVATADLARSVGLSPTTTRDYLSYLDTVFLTVQLPAWSTNLSSKITKTPKAYVTDSGLAANLLGVDPEGLRRPGHAALGGLVETFVVTELGKLLSQQDSPAALRYYRDRDGREIDLVLEARDGRIVGIEVKASATARSDDFRHLRWLRDRLGDRFTAGVVLYLGEGTYSFGDRLLAAPLSTLWHHAR